MLISAIGLIFSRPAITLIKTKPELIDGAVTYFNIYMLGMPGIALFNYGNAVLSAAGDTKRPLFYLSLAGIINIMWFSFPFATFMDNTIAANRGIGKTFVPSIIVFIGSCLFRILWVYTVFAWFGTIETLFLLYIFSWILTAAAEIVYFVRQYRKIKVSVN